MMSCPSDCSSFVANISAVLAAAGPPSHVLHVTIPRQAAILHASDAFQGVGDRQQSMALPIALLAECVEPVVVCLEEPASLQGMLRHMLSYPAITGSSLIPPALPSLRRKVLNHHILIYALPRASKIPSLGATAIRFLAESLSGQHASATCLAVTRARSLAGRRRGVHGHRQCSVAPGEVHHPLANSPARPSRSPSEVPRRVGKLLPQTPHSMAQHDM